MHLKANQLTNTVYCTNKRKENVIKITVHMIIQKQIQFMSKLA